MPTHKNDQKESVTMAKRFMTFCVTVLAGVVLLYLAVQLLSQFWGWLVLLAVIAISTYVVIRMLRARRNRW
jgi:Flp pilus assembly protein TadB